jgi:hypothetical protein
MASVTRNKKTRQIVQVVGRVDSQRSLVLIPLDKPTRKGNWGIVQVMRDENLVEDK